MEKIIEDIIEKNTELGIYDKNNAKEISEEIKISRNVVATHLKNLHSQGSLIKVNTNPPLFLNKMIMEKLLVKSLKETYPSLDELLDFGKEQGFEKLVGYNGSLKELVKQCKSTIAYPPNGLPMMLHGETGTGKSHIARATYEYAKNSNILAPNGKFIAINCSEYANNPELLTANLFGHVKGAFTGAERENPGLISLADGGVLFLDEVHNLKAECQEKLFQFMDQSIYHRVGDNEKWYKSNVRLIFATTENPEEVLLKTFQRRIVMTLHIPTLKERTLQEKIQLLYTVFKEEEKKIGKKIMLSSRVYTILLNHEFEGNLGGLISCVQSCCVNSLFETNERDEIEIRLSSLPPKIMSEYEGRIQLNLSKNEFIEIESLNGFITKEKEIFQLNEELIEKFNFFLQNKISKEMWFTENKESLNRYFDDVAFRKQEVSKIDFYQRGVQSVFELVLNQYGIKFTNNDVLAMSYYLSCCHRDSYSLYNWSKKNEEVVQKLEEFMKDNYYHEYAINEEVMKCFESYLDMKAVGIMRIVFLIRLIDNNKLMKRRKRLGLILAHGFSTASSMADASNKFLSNHVFDAIDMPINMGVEVVIQKINAYLEQVGKVEELLLLVDMGSLEEIYKGIEIKNINIGIVNNVSTKMALSIGNGMLQEKTMEEILKNIAKNLKINYHIEKNRQKEKIILCSCATGVGTAEKLSEMLEESLPNNSEIMVKTYDYNKLVENGAKQSFFEDYQVLCVIGTLNPNIKELNFIPIEDLIVSDGFNELENYIGECLTVEELQQFKKNIIRNFSLSNIMNSLTILNPNKLLQHVADAIDRLQQEMGITLTNNTCFGLYVHICCMIERVVMKREIEVYPDLEKFKVEEIKFIEVVRKSFQDVESFYGLEIPPAEVGYIFDYIKNDTKFN